MAICAGAAAARAKRPRRSNRPQRRAVPRRPWHDASTGRLLAGWLGHLEWNLAEPLSDRSLTRELVQAAAAGDAARVPPASLQSKCRRSGRKAAESACGGRRAMELREGFVATSRPGLAQGRSRLAERTSLILSPSSRPGRPGQAARSTRRRNLDSQERPVRRIPRLCQAGVRTDSILPIPRTC